jgi:hypothetical protein
MLLVVDVPFAASVIVGRAPVCSLAAVRWAIDSECAASARHLLP